MPSDIEILQAVERLRDEWPALLGDDAGKVARWLAATPGDDPEAVRRTVNRILDLLQAHPQAQTRLGRVKSGSISEYSRRAINGTAGKRMIMDVASS